MVCQHILDGSLYHFRCFSSACIASVVLSTCICEWFAVRVYHYDGTARVFLAWIILCCQKCFFIEGRGRANCVMISLHEVKLDVWVKVLFARKLHLA